MHAASRTTGWAYALTSQRGDRVYDRSAAWVRLQVASYLKSQTVITIQQTGLPWILCTIPFQGKTYPKV